MNRKRDNPLKHQSKTEGEKVMASMLREKDSTERHLNLCHRHVRLCNLQKGAELLANNMKSAMQNLGSKQENTKQKQLAREEAYDDVILADVNLDNGVKTSFEKCKQFDRDNVGENILPRIFPDSKFTTITELNRYEEPAAVNLLAVRLENLGPNHPLLGLAQDLRKQVAESLAAIEKLRQAEAAEKTASTEEDLARVALRKQFELNYLEARKIFGKEQAERLFVKISAPSTKNKKESPSTPAV
jgi:hypothetical protein